MDVRHLAFIADQSPAAVTPREYFWGMPKRGLAFLLANVMFWQPLWAQADGIVVATPGTSLGQAGNGVPIVNIATPNGSGLSHNQFHDYNVGTQGVILNNGSTQTLPTQLGGIVVGNPHLKNSGLAQTILNEVVGGNPSQLRGYTEVAGQSARVIVANPYGISCNGCGFINTPRVTLTTGKPVLDGSGRVDRYQVDQGSVSIEGAGINATNIDRFEIITRSAKINAEIQANNLTIIAGRNDVSAESLSASARANDGSAKPELAIDSSALGGMYAGAIKLVGTEGGVGVKLAGNMAASGGDIQIDANGHLTLAQTSAVGAVNVKAASLDAQGPVYAGTALNVQTQGNLTSQKTLAARDSIALSSGGVLTNSGIIEAGVNADNSRTAAGDVSLNAQNLTNSKSVVASRNLTVNASQTLNNQNGTLSAGQIADFTAGTLDNQNNGRVLSSAALNVTANQVLNTHGLINSTGDLTGTLGQLNNSNGEVSSAGITRLDAGGLDNRSGQVLGDLGLNIDLSGALDNRDGLLGSGKNVDLRAASLDNRDKGVLVSDAMLNARISGLLDNRNEGDISAKGAIELRSGNLDNRAGKVIGKHTLTISSDVADNSAGVIQADQHLKLQIGQMSNREKGLISGRADIAYDGLRMDNSGGLLSAFGPLKFNANEVQNLAGRISSQSDLTAVIGLLQQQGGALVAQGNLSLTGATLDNRNGGLVGTTKALTLKVDSVDNRAGEISANLMLNIAGKNLDNSDGGKVLAAGDLKLVVTNLVNQSRGQIVAKGATTVSGGTLDNSNGTLASLDGLVITLDEALINRQGLISSEGQLSADIGSLDNSAGTLTSAAGLSATSRGSLRNMGGSISTDSTLYLNSANLDNSQKGLISGNATATVVTGDFDNSQGGRLTGGATLSLTAKHVNNAAGRIASQNDLTASVSGLDQQGGELFSKTSLSLDLNHGQLNNQKGLINAPGLLLLKQLNSVSNEGGEISSAEAFTLAAQQLDNRNGKLLSNQDLTLRIARVLNNINGAISAASITSHSASLDNTDGLINSRGRLELSVDGSLNNQRGTVIADGDLVLTADSVDNRSGNIAGKADATVHATSLDNQTGQLITIGVLKLTADTLDNRQGGLLGATKAATLAVDQINNRGGEITTNADLLIVSKKLDNSEGGNVFSGTALTLTVDELINRNKALISAGAGMQLQGRALDNSGGSLLSSQNMQLTLSGVFTNEQGEVSSEGALVVDTAQLINSRGSLSSAADLHIDSVGSLSNQGGAIVTDSALTLTSASLDNRAQGSISAKGAMNVTTGAFDNSQSGRLSGASTLDLTAGQVTNQDDGRIGSEGALTASVTGLDQQGGKLFSNTTLSLDLNQGQLNNQNGLINASGALLLKRLSGVNNQNGEISSTEAFELAALNLDNSGGKLLSNQGLTLRIAKALDNVKGLVGASTLDLNAATLNNSGGTLNSRGDLNLITSDGLRNDTQGLINAAQILNVSSADLDNRNGSLLGGTAVILKAMALNNRDSGLINSQGNLSIIGTTLDSGNGGEVSATGDINLNLTALTQNGGRLLGSNAVTVDLGSGDFDNQNGVLVTKGPLTLNRLRDLHNQNGEISSDLSFNVIARALNNSAGKLISNQQLSITGTTMTNRNGLMSGWQGLAVNGGDFDNRDNGTLSSRSGDVAVGLGGVLLNGNAGALVSKGSLSVKAASLDNSNKGILSSGAGQTLVLNQALNNSQGGLIDSGTALDITAAEVTNVGGTINAQQAINTSATSLNNNGGQIAGNGALTLSLLGQLNNTAGKLVGTGPVLITGVSDLTNQNGQLASQSTLTLLTGSLHNSHSGTIAANDSLLINASGALANNDNGLIYSKTADMHLRAASVANGKGAIQGQNGLTLEIGGDLDNQSGNVIAENGMASIRAGNIDNRGGVLAAVRGTLNAHTVGVLRNGYDLNNNSQGGVIQGQGLTLSALAKLDNNGGRISAQAADASLVTGAFDNRNGVLSAKGLTAVTGSGLDNSTGQIAGNRIDLTLGDVLDNHNGIIESATNLTVSANSLDNQAGRLRSLANTGKTSFQIGGLLDNRNGVLETANTDLTLAVGNFLNAGGQLNHVGRGRFDIATANIVGAGGSITTGGLLELAADSWTNSSVIQAGRLSVNVNNFTQTASGQLLASESFQARGDNWNNDGLIASDGRVDIQLSGVYGGNGRVSAIGGIGLSAAQVSLSTTSSIAGGGDSTIEVGGQLINAGRLTSNGGLSVVAGSIVNNGTLGAAQNLKLDTPSLLNDRGLIFSGADMALNVSNFTNQSADLYGLGNLTIGGYGGAARAASVENISGTLESAGNFTLLADLFKNRTSGAVASGGRKLVSGFIANVCADCKGGTFTFMLKAREIYESTDSDSGASAMLSAGKDFVFQGGTFLNSKSTVGAGGNITINADSLQNIGSTSGTIERTVTYSGSMGAGTTLGFLADVVTPYNQRNNPDFPYVYYIDRALEIRKAIPKSVFKKEPGREGESYKTVTLTDSETGAIVSGREGYAIALPGLSYGFETSTPSLFDSSNLSALPDELNQLTLVSDIEVVKDHTGAASTGTIRNAVIQAGGNVAITAQKDLQNSVIHEDYSAAAGTNRIADTRVTGTGATVIRINAQLPPDLAQQQVNPLSLPGFALPTGQNGLFRLSDQANSNLAPGAGGTPLPGWSVSAENVSTLQHVTNTTTSGPRSLTIDSAASFSSSDRTVDPVKRSPTSVASNASALDVSVASSSPAAGRVVTSPDALPVVRVTGLPDVKVPASSHKYLIETNPVLTELKSFMSSDYLLSNLGYDPDNSAKRLGDGLYEQRLIQQAVVARTGQRYIDGQTTDEGLFKYLMNNAIASKQTLNLAVGVSLTSEQVAALTHDIVWLEEHEVNGEKVLVPVLYLAQAEGRLGPTGALIAGRDVSLIAGQNLDNVGTLKASNNLSATAGNDLVNSGLLQAGNRLDVLAANNVVNKSGGILAGRDVSVTALMGDVLNERTVTSQDSNTKFGTQHHDFADNAARIEAANDLRVSAGQDINIIGGELQSGRDMDLDAGRDLNVTATQIANSVVHSSKHNSSDITQLGSSLNAGRDLSAQAGRDLSVIASQIDAKRDIAMAATENLIISSAADEEHSLSKNKKVTRQEDHVSQVMSGVTAGGDVALTAGENLAVISSRITAGDEAYLVAGDRLDILAAQDTDYSLYDKKKKGSFGSLQTQHDEVTKNTHVGSEISSGGNLQLVSGGDQRYQVAKLDSGKDIVIDSGGSILFEGVKDLHDESHTKSDNDAFWNSSKGKGNTDETLRQTQMNAKGDIIIKAVDGLQIDIKEVNQQTVSQTIDAMVQADPQLAWLKEAEARGDVDWRQVKEIHESFKYSNSGLGPAAQLILAIAMAAIVGPAALSALSASMGAGWAAGFASVASSAATNAATSFINNGGDLGAVFQDVTSSDALKGYVISGVSAGLTTGYFNEWTGTTRNPLTGKITSPPLNTMTGVNQFAQNQLLQGGTSALLGKVLGQDVNMSGVMKTAVFNTLAAASFNAVGDYTVGIEDGSMRKIAIHAMVGGLLAEATGGDFRAGALAAGANEALINYLDTKLKGDDNLLTMSSQIVGVLTATTGKNVDAATMEKAAWVTKNASQYNRQLHREERELAKQLAARSNGRFTAEQIERQLRLSSVNGTEITHVTDMVASGAGIYDTGGNWIALGNGQYVQNFQPADREVIAYISSATDAYSWTVTAQTGFTSISDKADWSKTPNGPGTRDPLSGYPSDENGRYRVPVIIDGAAYAPRYLPCANAECLATGANIDFGDSETLKWLRAADVKTVNDIGWIMGVAAIPAGGVTSAMLSNGSVAASLLSGYLKDETLSSLATNLLSDSFEMFAVRGGLSEEAASKLANGMGAAGVWDAIAGKSVDILEKEND